MRRERRFPARLALMGEAEGVGLLDDEEEGEDVTRRGDSKYATEIMRLWNEGLGPGQIDARLRCSTKTVRNTLRANGVSEEAIEARTIRRKTKAESPRPTEDPRVADFDPVSDEDEGRDEAAPTVTIPWRDLCDRHKCETCLHCHVCGRVKIVSERPWIACRDWERRAS